MLRVVELYKEFRRVRGDRVVAVDGVSLDIQPGELLVVLGPSGCGKTTLLRCIAGLEEPTGGSIYSEDRLISSGKRGIIVPPEQRGFGMMFQSYAVWPHMSVYRNVAYPLKVRGLRKSEIDERVDQVLALVGIRNLRDEYSEQLSGGQQQRVALARCLIADPKVILFDEPLSNVDAKVREELRIELLTMQKRIGFAGVYVTHDQEEAMAIADRIMVMREGGAVQVAAPREVYNKPASRFVASFIGVINEFEGTVERRDESKTVVKSNGGELHVASGNVQEGVSIGDRVAVLVRPESLSLHTAQPTTQHENVWSGSVLALMYYGAHADYVVDMGGDPLRVRASQDADADEGDRVWATAPASRLRILRMDDAPSRDGKEGAETPSSGPAGVKKDARADSPLTG